MTKTLTAGTATGRKARVASLLAILTVVGALGACNTIAGAGKDTQAGGKAVEDAAKKAGS